MAYIRDFICSKCNSEKHEVDNHTGQCNDCLFKERDLKKRMFLVALKEMTLEDRIDAIEEKLYEMEFNKRNNNIMY